MNLVQKFPVGLALAACMMLSSCTQEDVQVAQPEKPDAVSNFKISATPSIPTTNAPAGNNKFAPGWRKLTMVAPDDIQLYASGTSNNTGLWGSGFLPWSKQLPNNISIGNFVTVTNQNKFISSGSTRSEAQTKISGLTPGKKYAVTFHASSTIRTLNGESTQYAPGIIIDIIGTVSPTSASPGQTLIDLNGKEAEWVSKTIVFEAQGSETLVNISPYASSQYHASHNKFYHYAHIFVGTNAVTEVQ